MIFTCFVILIFHGRMTNCVNILIRDQGNSFMRYIETPCKINLRPGLK